MTKYFKLILIAIITVLILSMPCFCLQAKGDYLNGVWVSSVYNLDFPSKQGLLQDQLKLELQNIVSTCKTSNINAIFFQVRPNSDALYKSNYFPWSRVISGTEGTAPNNNFDPLEYLSNLCKDNNIQLHAWINPYRICKAEQLNTLSSSNPAKKHPEYTVTCSDGYVYYNPALKEVRELITNGAVEIVKNYNVSGIHFDDYFYPYNVTDYPDSDDYKKYGTKFKTVEDFRRDNVNKLVKQVYNAVHKQNKNAIFGVSPFGIWDNKSQNKLGSNTSGMSSYSVIFADSYTWVKNGWVDYICPQIYWSTENTVANFKTLVDWWGELCSKYNCDLLVGHALYKLGEDSEFISASQIQSQIDYCKSNNSVNGSVFFRYQNIKDNTLGCQNVISQNKFTVQNTPAFTTNELIITSPSNNYSTTAQNCSISGVANTNYKLFLNNSEIEYTQNGYFTAFVDLKPGKNTFTFTNGQTVKTVVINRKNQTQVSKLNDKMFVEGSLYPSGECGFSSNEIVTITLKAKTGVNVFALHSGKQIDFVQTETNGDVSTFSAQITMTNALFSDIDYGIITYFINDGQTITDLGVSTNIKVLSKPKLMYANTDAYIFDSAFGGSMMQNYQMCSGSICLVSGYANNMYRLSSGKWVSVNDLTDQKQKYEPKIDKKNYQTLIFNSKTPFEAYTSVNENGELVINTYGSNTLECLNGSDFALEKTNANTYTLNAKNGIGGFYAHQKNAKELVVYILKPNSSIKNKTIVIDAGHGGSDAGALGPAGKNGATEADLNLSLSLIVANKLKQKGANVVLTRADNSTLLLKERSQIIRNATPDLCVSIHHNSLSVETDYKRGVGALALYSRNTSKKVADLIAKKIPDCKAKAQSLSICREFCFPSVLIECGFVCNPTEYEKIITNEFKEQISDNIVAAICDYFVKMS